MRKFLSIVFALLIVGGVGTASFGEIKAKPDYGIEKESVGVSDSVAVDNFTLETVVIIPFKSAAYEPLNASDTKSIEFETCFEAGPPLRTIPYQQLILGGKSYYTSNRRPKVFFKCNKDPGCILAGILSVMNNI